MNRAKIGNTYSTIISEWCAVRWFHKHTAGYGPGVNVDHAIVLRGIRRFTNPIVKQHSVTPVLLRTLFPLIDLCQTRGQLLWGRLVFAFFFPAVPIGILVYRVKLLPVCPTAWICCFL